MTDRRPTPALTVAVALMFYSVARPLLAGGAQNEPNITQFKTYTWVTVGGSEHGDKITSAQIKQAIDAQLSAKGLTKTDGTSDLELEYWVEVQPERLSIANGSNMGMGVGGGLGFTPTTSPATETLHLYAYDAATKQPVWQATATRAPDRNPEPEKRQKNIDKTVAKLLRNFPTAVK
jgi:hypothetical protein